MFEKNEMFLVACNHGAFGLICMAALCLVFLLLAFLRRGFAQTGLGKFQNLQLRGRRLPCCNIYQSSWLDIYDGVVATLGHFVQANITEWLSYFQNITCRGAFLASYIS